MEANVFETLTRFGVIPVVTIDRIEAALPLADALIESGLPVVEITFRTPAAARIIQELESRPELLVGAGTVLSVEQAQAAKRSGARFGVAPGLNEAVVAEANALKLPFIPGVATPSEIERGLSLGCAMLKLFPASVMGGPALARILAGPYGHTGVRFMPSGGVTVENLAAYLACPIVAAVGGTWIANQELIAASDWGEIRNRAQAAREIVTQSRANNS